MPGIGRAVIACSIVALAVLGLEASGSGLRAAGPGSIDALRADLTAIFTEKSIDQAEWGVAIDSLRYGDTLFAMNAHRLLVPASNQKLITAAVAAERLGWDFRYTTRLLATGPIDDTGTLRGSLVVVGNGDPTINRRHPERERIFDAWAAALAERGIRAIEGNLIGDDNAWDEESSWGMGWMWDDLSTDSGAPVGPLQYNESVTRLTTTPGAPGAAPGATVTPEGADFRVEMLATTGPAGSETKLAAVRLPGSPRLVVRGQIAADAQPVVEAQAVENPTQFYVNALGAALAAHGITVGGRAVDVDDLALPPDETRATLLLEDQSPPLSDIIDVTLKWSRNGYAETLLRTLPPFGERGSEARGLEVLRDTLRTWGIAEDYYIVRDGSGLSRYDHVSPNALTWLLTYMYLDPTHADHFRASLPVAGVAGTLSHRMASTAAAGRVWAKSGSLSQVRGLSGYMLTKDDEPLVFSILVNGYRGSSAEVEAVMDRALARVARFTRARAAH